MKKRVLLVTPELQYTGALQSFRRICIVLINNGYLIDVWSYTDGPYRHEFEKIGVDIRITPENIITEEFINREVTKYNLIISNTIVTYKVADYAQNIVPVVWYIREAQNLPDFFWKKEREVALRRAKKIYVVSEYAQEFVIKNYNSNVHVVHNFVDDVYLEEGSFLPLDKKNEKIKFLALGTIEKRKGYDVLIDGFNKLPAKIKEQCELHFAGRLWEGAKDFYPDILNEAENADNIFYHGELREREAIHALINSINVVVVPSRDESCSLVALEGAMMAKPLILSQNIGAKYVVTDDSGWIIPTGDVDAMCAAYINAFNNIDVLHEMGKKSRQNYLQTSTYEIYEKNILKMVNDNIADDQYIYRVQENAYEFLSFDIFDTLIYRNTALPYGVFLQMQDCINKNTNYSSLPYLLRLNFAEIRTSTERFMYRSACTDLEQDITFDEIYDVIAQTYSLDEYQCNLLKTLEIETEKQLLHPIKYNIHLVKKLINSGKKVVLISDMYYSQKILRQILVGFDEIFEDIPIYVSSEYRLKKNNGRLYDKVKQLEKTQTEKWMHYGDDWEIDIIQAKQKGICGNYYNIEKLMDFEQKLIQKYPESLYVQHIVGISKACRIENSLTQFESLGASLGGPYLFPYVYWVIQEAKNKEIKTLYFVARDGYVLKKIADKIIRYEKIELKTKYIYGSREVWRKPVETDNKNEILLAKKYINQEVDKSEKYGFVEFIGTGKTLNSVIELLETKDNMVGSYYLYLSTYENPQVSKNFSMVKLNKRFKNRLELLVRAPHGQTIGYEEKENIIIPIFDEQEGQALVEYGYLEYVAGVELFVDKILEKLAKLKINPLDLTVFNFYNDYMCFDEMDYKVVNFLGGIPFVLDGKVTQVTEYAPRLTLDDVDLIYKLKTKKYWGNCIEWSIARSSDEVKQKIREIQAPVSNMSQKNAFNKEGQLQSEINALKMEIDNIHKSKSYKFGRILTWVPRKIRGGIKCYREHGMSYTLRRFLFHIGVKNDSQLKIISKTGKKIAWLPKKIRGGIQCYKEHGFTYTLKRGFVHLGVSKENVKERTYDYYAQLSPSKYKKELKLWYKKETGKELDLKNPKNFNEKIQWLKIYDSTPQKTRLADKYAVREWIEETIGEKYLIPLLGVWECFDDIDFDKLPNQFVLKTNHGSGWNLVVKDKSKLDKDDAKKKFDLWMSRNFAYSAGLELHYLNIPPKIIAEEYIADLDGDVLDYRFFCFSGVPRYIWVDVGSGTRQHKRNIYDLNWNLQNYKVSYPLIEPNLEKPNTLQEMIRLAEKLSQGFSFVRVDFYSIGNTVYFGEMTFTSQSGIGKWEFEEINNHYGDLIALPKKSRIPKKKRL